MTPAEVRARIAESRTRQGLPAAISDPATLAKLAAQVAEKMADQAEGVTAHAS
jgi:hypothetical protein